jgi:hypothetical protein
MTNLLVYANCDNDDLPLGSTGVNWIEISISDYIIFTNGSVDVADGQPIPTELQLNHAGVVISPTVEVIYPKYLLADVSAAILREIFLAGNQNKMYVFAADFDGATASEPVLELWDIDDLNTIDYHTLGDGVADNSWFRGVTTTAGLPGNDWAGSKLAGSEAGYFLLLNNGSGALSTAKTLYFNLKAIAPANYQSSGVEQPVFAIKYTTN